MTISGEAVAGSGPRARLSPSQEGLWFLNQLEPNSSAYHNVLAIRFGGALDVGVLERCLLEIVRRHEALRLRLAVIDGMPSQYAVADAEIGLRVEDVAPADDGDRIAVGMRRATEEARQPFDLASGPAIRALLLRMDATDWLLVLTVHHVVSDGTGITILMRELITLYAAYVQGEPSPLPDIPIGYLDAARRSTQRLAGRLDDGIAYWQERLGGAPPVLQLPLDRPRSTPHGRRGANYRVRLDRELTDAVRELGAREGVTRYMTFLAALQLLLHRYTGQEDVLVGSPMTGRSRRDLRGMIAYLANTIVLRTEVQRSLTVHELLDRVRTTAFGAFRNSDIPFERVVRALRPVRDPSYHPVFQVVLSYHERGDGWLHEASFEIPTLRVSFPRMDISAPRFELSLCVHEVEESSLGIDFEYDADLFDAATIERMAGHFLRLLRGLTEDPDRTVGELEMLTPAEREQIERWSRGPVLEPVADCIHQLVEAQAVRTPGAAAVFHGPDSLTYGQLDRRANQVAHRLRRLGVRRGQLVGVCLRRSPELVVGLLGVLKAGAGYVFFEPGLPPERREFMMRDCGARAVLAEEATLAAVPDCVDAVLCLDRDRGDLDAEPALKPAEWASPDDLAYCVYTSGSTGMPKAVAIQHGGCVSFLQWAASVFGPEDLAGSLSSSSPMFDCPLFELYVPLCWGGTAVMAGSLLELPDLDPATPVTMFMGAPTVTTELLAAGGIPASVRAVVLAGEAVPHSLPQELYRRTNVQRVFNYYGISETTTLTMGSLVPREEPTSDAGVEAASDPLIGRPIANASVHVLDEARNRVPIGITGELYIGGVGVARGYLSRPELTAERFVRDPFSDEAASRLYRSGDLARYRASGDIEYVGRIDRQVKLRGFRIELGEIESALASCPGVDQAAILVREDEPGHRRLVGYVVAATGVEVAPAELRAQLRARLPEHEVPAAYVMLDAMPLTANGKVDAATLPAPEPESTDGVELWRLADAIETQLRLIWNEALGTVEADARDSFFDVGGDSLRAVVMLNQVQEMFGIRVPVGAFMAEPTIEGLGRILRDKGWNMPDSCLAKVFGVGDQRPLFCIHPGGGELYELRYLQKELGDRPVYALMPVGWNGEEEPLASIEEMADRYLTEIRRVQPTGPYLMAGLSLGGLVAFEMAQRLRQDGEEVAFLGLLETWPVLEGAVCLPEDAYEYESTAAAQELAALTGRVAIPAQELLYMKRLAPAVPALDELQRSLEEKNIYDFDGLCRELEDMRPKLRVALDELKQRGLVVNELDMADFFRMHEVAAKQIWAKSAYRPVPYPGRAVLFAGPSVDLPLLNRVWEVLVGELSVERIEEEVHTELLRDPQLAAALRRRIDEAEERIGSAAAVPTV